MAQYRRALAEYQEAQAAYAAEADAYWSLITQKRRERIAKRASQEPLALDDYVLTQPPVYSRPAEAGRSVQTPEEKPSSQPALRAGGRPISSPPPDEEFKFVPRQPQSETEFKRAYAASRARGRAEARADRPHL